MKKERKKLLMQDIKSIINIRSCILLISMDKMLACDFMKLRSDLWQKNADVKFVKNNLLKMVLYENGIMGLSDSLLKQTAIIYSDDIVDVSKVVCAFRSNYGKIEILNMLVDKHAYEKSRVEKIASLPNIVDLYHNMFFILKYTMINLIQVLEYKEEQRVAI